MDLSARILSIALGLAALSSGQDSAPPAVTLYQYLESGKLTPALAASAPPLKLLSQISYAPSRDQQGMQKEQAAYLSLYAAQLRVLNDQKFPKSDELRAGLAAVLSTTCHLIFLLDQHRASHDGQTIPAYTEWLLHASDPGFQLPATMPAPAGQTITHETIRSHLATTVSQRNGQANPPATYDPAIGEILGALTRFEAHLNEAGRQHFRAVLLRFIDQSFQ